MPSFEKLKDAADGDQGAEPVNTTYCGDCGCAEGELHNSGGCDQERCPFCGGQLLSCNCIYERLYPKYDPNNKDCCGLPMEVYTDGPTEKDQRKWDKILEKKGRIPYIRWPIVCAYCGVLWPEFFWVSDEEWKKYVEPEHRRAVLCRSCWRRIKTLCRRAWSA